MTAFSRKETGDYSSPGVAGQAGGQDSVEYSHRDVVCMKAAAQPCVRKNVCGVADR